jgi:hypothetical protein
MQPKETKMFTKIDDYQDTVKHHKSTMKHSPKQMSLFGWGVMVIFLAMLLMLSDQAFKANTNQWSMESTEVAFPDTDTPISSTILPTPETSVLSTDYALKTAKCPLTIFSDHKNYYIKLYDMHNGEKVIAQFFLRSNEKLKTAIPTGIYMLKYISGSQWYGEENAFGLFGNEGKSNPLHFDNDHMCKKGKTIFLSRSLHAKRL